MNKTPEQIKKGLECCTYVEGCKVCPYKGNRDCSVKKNVDGLSYINRLEQENANLKEMLRNADRHIKGLEAERDAMIESLRKSKACCVCANRNTRDPNKNAYDITAKCIRCVCGESQFEWRGLCDENSEAKE